METIKKMTIANRIIAAVSWLLCLGVLVLNLLGCWDLWHLIGFLSYPCALVSVGFALIVFLKSKGLQDTATKQKYVRHNGIVLTICGIMTVLDVFVFATWFGL